MIIKIKKLGALAGCIALCELAGIIGSFFTLPAIGTWYASLSKPPFSPPDWVFAPVWLSLYALMGISLYLVLRRGTPENNSGTALSLFSAQLLLNVLWSFLFFGMRSLALGFAGIVLLWFAIFGTVLAFRKISRTAALLLLPYLLWVSFAALLNLYVMLLNP
ncbi:MAG: TspO/MBR family protein [Candidatus Diapherotrites archaeon]